MSEGEPRPPSANAFAPHMSGAMPSSGSATAEDAEEPLLRAFVGPKADYYLGKWRPSQAGPEHSTGFNWAAFLLSGLWLPYRKMYTITLILLGIILVESVAEEVLFVGILGEPEPPLVLSRVIGLGVAVLCGAYGNRWYLAHARKAIAEVRAQGFDQQATHDRLAKRGGTSWLSPVLTILAYIAVLLVVFLLMDSFLYTNS